MRFKELMDIVGHEAVFDTGLLLAGHEDPKDVQRQLSRWTKAGRLYQLRRGLYALAPPFQKVKPHPFVIANRMVRASYVSCESALEHYGLIPERVPVVISVTTGRPARWDTPLGSYRFRHVKTEFFRGYQLLTLDAGQQGFVATPEKALLDLTHLRPRGDSPYYLRELRLQNLGLLDLDALQREATQANSAKLRRAAQVVADLARSEAQRHERL